MEDIDSPWEADIPYEASTARRYALYQDVNFRYWFTDKEIQQLRGHVQQFEVPRPEYELILTYYRKPVGLERGVYTTSSQIIGRFGNTSLRLSLQKVGRAMRELGFRQVKAPTQTIGWWWSALPRRYSTCCRPKRNRRIPPAKSFRREYRTPLLTPLVEDMEDIFQTFHYMKVRSIFL